LGLGLIGSSLTGILALLVGIFASNFPEALGGAVEMRDSGGRSRGFIVSTWMATAMLLTVAAVVGNTLLTGASEHVLAFARALASGGSGFGGRHGDADVYRQDGPVVAFAMAAGFLLTFLIS
jgi:ZIP family zinc transporter